MRSSAAHRSFHRLVRLLLPALALATAAASGAETWIVGNRTYEQVRVSSVNDGSVTIFHRGGISQLELAALPAELQARFGYDQEKAETWKQEAEAGRAATRERERETLELKKKLAQEEAGKPEAGNMEFDWDAFDARFELKPEVDLRPAFQQHGLFLKDQGRRPSCAIFALLSALEFEYAHAYGRPEPLSEEFLIWAVRELQPGIPIDDGYHFGEVVSALQTYGVASQRTMPNTFGVRIADIKPSPEALAEATVRRTVVPVWLRPNDPYLVGRIIDALNRDKPVVVGIRWPHWRTLDHNHLLRDQVPIEGAAHAVTIIGYQCPDGVLENTVFVFRNSYGVNWGLGGCGLLAASYVHEHTLAAFHLVLPGMNPLAQRDR